MDKNTLTGLVLMAAVMFGFFWLTKPSEADLAAQRERQEQQAREALKAAQEQNKAAALNFSAGDSASLVAAVRTMGTPDGTGRLVFSNEHLSLSLDSVSGLSGYFTDGADSVAIADILANRAALTASRSARANSAVRAMIDNAVKYEGFARHLSGANREVVLENELVKITLNTRGGRVAQVELKKYQTELTEEPSNILLFRDATDGYGFRFNTAEQRIDTRDFNFIAETEGDSAVVMSLVPGDGVRWGIRYALAPDSYTLSMEIVQQGMASLLPGNTSSMEFGWHQKMGRNERGRTFEERNSAIYYKYVGEGVDELDANKDDSESLTGRLRWVAFKDRKSVV